MKKDILLLVVAAVLLAGCMLVEHFFNLSTWQLLLLYLIPYLLVGHETLHEAVEGIIEKDIFNEDFLMAIATIGALLIGFFPNAENEFAEAVFVMLFFKIGELFEEYAEDKSRDSITKLMDIRPDTANVERNSKVVTVAPETVEIGEIIVVKPGEKIPLDGVVVEGNSNLNTVALTGESVPRGVAENEEVISGCVNLSGLLRIKTTKTFSESTVSKIIDLVENASEHKSKTESFITRFARVYTPIVVISALLLAFIPPLIQGNFLTTFPIWLQRALTFLVVSCPCALVISIPLSFFGGLGGASRKGILIKGSNYIDALNNLKTVVFDKTGTLTHGVFSVSSIHPEKISEQELLHLAAHVEHYSTHPIAVSLCNAYKENCEHCKVENIEEVTGQGICANINGKRVCVGNAKLMSTENITYTYDCNHIGTIVHVAIDGEYAGHIEISDQIKEDSEECIISLKEKGIQNLVMLTGDRKETADFVAQKLGLSSYYAELLPTDKVSYLEKIIREKAEDSTVAFVGDGINDAPVLALADVGIAMGGLGSDAAIEAADVVLMDDKPSKIALAINMARRTINIAKQNAYFAIGIKILVLILAALGIAQMWMAVFADVGVMVLVVLNAMRTLKVNEND